MDYNSIAPKQRKFIKKLAYKEMSKREKQIYLKHVKRLILELDDLSYSSTDTSDDSSDTSDTSSSDSEIEIRGIASKKNPKLNSRYITFVGIKHRDARYLSPDYRVRLEKDDYLKDPSAVMVKVYKEKKWIRVAYVARKDAEWLRSVDNFEKLPLNWVKSQRTVQDTQTSCTYSIDLKPLEESTSRSRKGAKIPTKKDVSGEKYRLQSVEIQLEGLSINTREKKKKSREELPLLSQADRVTDEYWACIFRNKETDSFLESTSYSSSGRWTLLYDEPLIYEKLSQVRDLFKQEKLGHLIECLVTDPDIQDCKKVIAVHTPDYKDVQDVYKVAMILYKELQYGRTMYYRSDAQMNINLFTTNGSKKNYMYRYPVK
jgi:hypothetical protein